ncbi:phage portal protein, HK97 family [Lactobacillus selangorensis]|uniref:Phage portal protein, HK97 family n=2 Tax=Lactobacillus selangorensis TaxID=81857 RepID=A0A0R2FSK9_9LACO|nr:phage portal protein, HK97 family [Lactobacillus selangorensis]KRN30294.1 phage portal protein, HK97 family [Lactobacillus selangorensis]
MKNLVDASQTVSLSDPALINFFNPGKTWSYVSADKALEHSDLYAVISLISSDLARADFNSAKKSVQGLINNPSPLTNRAAFWQAMYAQLLLDGNSYAYIWRNINGTPLYLEYLRPSQVQVKLLDDGSGLVYDLTFDEPSVAMKTNVPASDMIHFRLMSKNGGKTGVSPLYSLTVELSLQDSSNSLARDALSSAINPTGILKLNKGSLLNAGQKAATRQSFVDANKGASGPLVLDDLEDYVPLEIKTDVSKLLDSTDWTGDQISKVYHVPKDMTGTESEHSNIEQVIQQYNTTIGRYSEPVVSELENKLHSDVSVDVKQIIDIDGSRLEKRVRGLRLDGIISSELAQEILLRSNSDVLTQQDIDAALSAGKPIIPPATEKTSKGGEPDGGTGSY